ncbi:peptide deformylase [Neomegalonema sp.]|uniref:peptide deformylase n=1 Tax=Neomegalonema sp. TaxID=2039713 RepID=UPI00261587D2|nr:peptide deformylase [Neomegalonema sp.]MDD2867077.1 peptide deformylase [Neomegalonema sp.]
MTAQIRPILIHPDRRLRAECEPVAEVDDSIRALIEDMLATMYDAPGVGLAAPQVGVLKRVIVMDCVDKDALPAPVAMVNPEILRVSEELNVHEEGCLSVPEEYVEVTRPARVRVRWLDAAGAPQEADFEGLWATCVQHEIDHLDGRLFIDYVGPLKRKLITERMKKLKRARAREQEEREAGVA